MKRTTRLGVTFVMLATMLGLVIGASLPANGQSNGGSKGVGAASLQRLRRDAIGDVKLSVDRGTRYVGFARVATGGDLFPESRSATPQGKAGGFFAEYARLFGIRNASAELRLVSTKKDAQGFTHVSYEQTYRGLPVFAGLVRAHLDRANRLTAVNGTFVPNVDLSTDARLSPAQAAQKAIADVLARPPVTEESADGAAAAPTGLRAASTTLEVYRMGLVRNVPGSNQLVYEVEVTNGADVREFVFVHANAGKIVNRYSGVHNDLFRRVFEENFDPDDQVWEEGDPFPGDLTEDQQNIVTFSGHSYHFFSHAFGRDSYDGEGAEMQTVNNDPRINCPNANWNGITTNYCTGVTGDDTVAHEWGHAYTEYTHNLIYQWQSGALNESYSDIWGDVVDLINGAGQDTPGGNRAVGTCSSQTGHKNWPTVIVNQPAALGTCAAAPAGFGPRLNTTGVTADVVLSNDGKGSPTDGCTSPNNAQAIDGNIALVDRGTCTFTVKVANMQKVGATGVMIVNNIIGGPSIMPGVDPSITIPSVMISRTAGASIKQALPGANVTMKARATSGSSFRWLSGEDDPAFDGAIRDMWDPTCLGDPGKVTDQEYFCAGDDNGGVHTNSGVPNHGFALLVDGGTYNGKTVAGIGLTKAAHLYWRAGSVYQTPSSDFPDHADALLASCNDLVGVRLPNLGTGSSPPGGARQAITSGNCASVLAMTDAVEFRTDPTTQCNFQPILRGDAPPVCGDQTADVVFTEDFETGLDGWTLTNQGVFEGWPDLDWTTDSSLPAGETGSAAFGADPDGGDCGAGANDISGVMRMESPSITLPGGTLRLSFDHYIATEQGWDGGNVSISVNGRAHSLIPASAFLFNPYNATLQTAAAGNTNPLAGQPGFTGTDAGELVSSWGTSIIDLAATGARLRPGDVVRFRFDMGMDGCTGIDGWYVDDVTVSACGAAAATKEEAASARSTRPTGTPYARAMDVLSYRPDPSEFAWTFGGVPPVRTVRPGDILELWTEDAFGGKVRGPDDHVSRVIEFPFVNPQTGPFFVEGAEPGDTLAIHFISIEPSRDWAASCTVPLFGALTATARTAMLHDPLPERVWIYEVDRSARTVTYRATEGDHVSILPLDPMHGTVGVAPAAFEARSSLVPDAHGGNMDTPEMRAGVTCYLGVNVEGALFSIGDGHCRQGEGETCGVAVEAAMDTVIAVDVVKGRPTPWPRLESDTHLMSTGSARPLEDAFRIAHADLVSWMGDEFGLEALDAYQLLTQVSESPVANVVDPNYTFLTKVRKEYLPRVETYDGVHARLRDTAVRYRG